MAKQAITLNIAGIRLPFSIDTEKEEMYRLAEREVNTYLVRIQEEKRQGWTDKHYLVMAALRFAITAVKQRLQSETDNDDLRKIEELSTEIDDYLNRLED